MIPTSKLFYVDILGFIVNNKFVLKELGIVECDAQVFYCSTHKTHRYLFKPPFEWKELSSLDRTRALHAKCNRHGLSWNDGNIDYMELRKIIKKILITENASSKIYLANERKVKWFNELTKERYDCISLWPETHKRIDYNTLERDDQICKRHRRSGLRCAQRNAWGLHFDARESDGRMNNPNEYYQAKSRR